MATELTGDYEDIVLDIIRTNYYMATLLNLDLESVSNKIDLVSNATSLVVSGNKLTNSNPIVFNCPQGSVVSFLKLYKGGSSAYESTHYVILPIDGSGGGAFTFTTAGKFTYQANQLNLEVSHLLTPNLQKTSQFEEDVLFNFKTNLDRAVILDVSNNIISDVATISLTSNGNGVLYNASNIVFNCDNGDTPYWLKVYQNGYEATRSMKLHLEPRNTFVGDGTFTIYAEGISIEI